MNKFISALIIFIVIIMVVIAGILMTKENYRPRGGRRGTTTPRRGDRRGHGAWGFIRNYWPWSYRRSVPVVPYVPYVIPTQYRSPCEYPCSYLSKYECDKCLYMNNYY